MHAPTAARDEAAQLRQALDNAIYTLEDIKRRAGRGATSEVASWYCEEIRELAATALAKLESACPPSVAASE